MSVELKLYSPLHVELIDLDRAENSQLNEANPIVPLEMVGSGGVAAHTEWLLDTIRKLQPQMDARNAFINATASFKNSVSPKIISLSQSVEKIGGRLYGVAVCQSRGTLDHTEVQELKNYCQNQYNMGRQDGYAHSPRQAPYKGLYIHYWQDGDDRLLTRTELDTALASGQISRQTIVTEINKDTFWTLIHEAKRLWGQDQEGAAHWLEDQLLIMGPRRVRSFDSIAHGYLDLANKYGLWSAASIMLEGCTDDGFMDFRGWLIYQGKETYLAALKDPDSLADVQLYADGCFESLAYIGDSAYEKLTCRHTYDIIDRPAHEALKKELAKDIQYGDGIGYPYSWKGLADYLPRLCARYVQPEMLAERIRLETDIWNSTNLDVQTARKTEAKSSRIQKSSSQKMKRRKDESR